LNPAFVPMESRRPCASSPAPTTTPRVRCRSRRRASAFARSSRRSPPSNVCRSAARLGAFSRNTSFHRSTYRAMTTSGVTPGYICDSLARQDVIALLAGYYEPRDASAGPMNLLPMRNRVASCHAGSRRAWCTHRHRVRARRWCGRPRRPRPASRGGNRRARGSSGRTERRARGRGRSAPARHALLPATTHPAAASSQIRLAP